MKPNNAAEQASFLWPFAQPGERAGLRGFVERTVFPLNARWERAYSVTSVGLVVMWAFAGLLTAPAFAQTFATNLFIHAQRGEVPDRKSVV